MTAERNHDGFTLIEVLVALAILAIVLGASLRASGVLTNGQNALRQHALADFSADNSMALVRVEKQRLDQPDSSFDCPQADLKLTCTVRVTTTPNPALRRVDVSVTSIERPGESLAHRVAFMGVMK
jgi:general secretion pathway protein I